MAIDVGEAKAWVAGIASAAPAAPATTIFVPSPLGARSPIVHDGSLRCCGVCRRPAPEAFVLLFMIDVSLVTGKTAPGPHPASRDGAAGMAPFRPEGCHYGNRAAK
jgi:hypothetical protein